MKCTLNPNIQSISGKVGGMLFRTYKRRDGSTETRAYMLPHKRKGGYGYERKARVTENEMAARAKFTQISTMLSLMTDEQRMQYARQWKEAKYMFNGKKYNTLRGYIMARLYKGV